MVSQNLAQDASQNLKIHVRQNTELEALFDLSCMEKLELVVRLLIRHA